MKQKGGEKCLIRTVTSLQPLTEGADMSSGFSDGGLILKQEADRSYF